MDVDICQKFHIWRTLSLFKGIVSLRITFDTPDSSIIEHNKKHSKNSWVTIIPKNTKKKKDRGFHNGI